MKLHPGILRQPNIPKPLHGLNPRSIMGQEWWNKERQKAYASMNYHCYACGVHKRQAKLHKWLEAHESYKFHYTAGRLILNKIVPLCPACHKFIHSGRLVIAEKDSVVDLVLEHGMAILSKNNMQCFPGTYDKAHALGIKPIVEPYRMPEINVKWKDWRLVFNGKEYEPLFDSFKKWQKHYNR